MLADCGAALRVWAELHRELGWPDTTPEYLQDGYFRLLESSADISAMTAYATIHVGGCDSQCRPVSSTTYLTAIGQINDNTARGQLLHTGQLG